MTTQIPLPTIRSLYVKLLSESVTAKECRQAFHTDCNEAVFAAFENHEYQGKRMLFYVEREGGQLWLRKPEWMSIIPENPLAKTHDL